MKFSEKYPVLFQLFSGYFYDASFDGLSEADVIQSYVWDHSTEIKVLEKAVAEIDRLILELEFYLDEVGTEANVYFENKEGALNWLERLKMLLVESTKSSQ